MHTVDTLFMLSFKLLITIPLNYDYRNKICKCIAYNNSIILENNTLILKYYNEFKYDEIRELIIKYIQDKSIKTLDFEMDTIENICTKFDWIYISKNNYNSIYVMRRCKNYLDWKIISKYYNLCLDITEEFKYLLDWYIISRHRKLSLIFIKTFQNFIDMDIVLNYNPDTNIKIKHRFSKKYGTITKYSMKNKYEISAIQ
jgi:hypothetical protein